MDTTKTVKHRFPYRWNLFDGYPESNGLKVFGTFICGGGSTMGYKLAGFDHLGGVEIDPKVADVYKANHNPKHLYVEDIRKFVKRTEFPKELYDLDILDGSPPCSSFSMAGNREKDWGKEKVFREGQALQTLDDLFFDYIALAKKLQPKVVIAENVKGLIQGNAKSYVHKIKKGFEDAGYRVQLFLLNAASMGVPQKRERVFFICQRNDLNYPKLELRFDERAIPFGDIAKYTSKRPLKEFALNYWKHRIESDMNASDTKFRIGLKKSDMNCCYLFEKKTVPTITSKPHINYNHPSYMSNESAILAGSFPLDYNFKTINPLYLIGMSVPPVMTAQIANQLSLQWFNKTAKQQRGKS